jgi:threonine/homoserine/homoserine lactone efflux protein
MELYLLFVVMAAVTVASPGPGVLMSLTNALHYGWRETFAGILGVATGALVVAAISATSVGVVLAASATAFTILKYVGAAYLIYLGVRLFRAPPFAFKDREVNAGSAWRRFVEGITLQFTNPKAIFFFLSVFPQFIAPDANYALQFAQLVLTYFVLVVVIHCVYAAFAQRAKGWFTSHAGGRILNRSAGSVFVVFGALLAMSKQRVG